MLIDSIRKLAASERKEAPGGEVGMKNLGAFVSNQRTRVKDEHNNTFAFSWSKVFRRFRFLEIIKPRHDAASAAFAENSNAFLNALSGESGTLSPEAEAIQADSYELSSRVHLEIESYYLFAKIVLDDVARAEYYFGPV